MLVRLFVYLFIFITIIVMTSKRSNLRWSGVVVVSTVNEHEQSQEHNDKQ